MLRVILQGQRKTGHLDLEAVEMLLRTALHKAGAAVLSQLLQFPEPPAEQRHLPCSCGQQARYLGLRSKTMVTVLGQAVVSRPYYLCPHCHVGQFPADQELDVERTEYSPGVRRMLALVGQQSPFEQGHRQMELLAGIEVTTKAVERTAEAMGEDIARRERQEIDRAVQLDFPLVIGQPVPIMYVELDGTGIRATGKETENRPGKQDGQPAHTREAKLGCVFTQTSCDKDGYPIRDPDSTTYVGAIETAEQFGKRLYVEAWKRGWSQAQTKVVLGDGAEWIWNIADQHFPGAIQIVDLFHARQRLWNVARALHPLDPVAQQRWILRHQPKLDAGRIDKLIAYLESLLPEAEAPVREALLSEIGYFRNNASRMRYSDFRTRHLFVGSGVIEAACKTVIGARLKQSGMFWTVRGANAILALRCCCLNNRFEDYWAQRHAA